MFLLGRPVPVSVRTNAQTHRGLVEFISFIHCNPHEPNQSQAKGEEQEDRDRGTEMAVDREREHSNMQTPNSQN
jgi:hypothetical protein